MKKNNNLEDNVPDWSFDPTHQNTYMLFHNNKFAYEPRT